MKLPRAPNLLSIALLLVLGGSVARMVFSDDESRAPVPRETEATLPVALPNESSTSPAVATPGRPASGLNQLIDDGAAEERVHELLIRWTARDPRAAMEWAGRLLDPDTRRSLLRVVAREWALADFESARHWLARFTSPDRDEVVVTMASALLSGSPRKSVQVALQLSPGGQQPALLGQAVAEWAVHEPRAAAEWTGRLPTGDLRNHALVALATLFAEDDGKGAATLAFDLHDDALQATAVGAIIQRWTRLDPLAAAEWIVQLTPGPAQTAAVENLVATWSNRAPEEVEQWLDRVAASRLFEPATRAFVAHLANRDPSALERWRTSAIRRSSPETAPAFPPQ